MDDDTESRGEPTGPTRDERDPIGQASLDALVDDWGATGVLHALLDHVPAEQQRAFLNRPELAEPPTPLGGWYHLRSQLEQARAAMNLALSVLRGDAYRVGASDATASQQRGEAIDALGAALGHTQLVVRPDSRTATDGTAPVQLMRTCPTCDGDGGDLDDSTKPCYECDGTGTLPVGQHAHAALAEAATQRRSPRVDPTRLEAIEGTLADHTARFAALEQHFANLGVPLPTGEVEL